MNKNTNNINNNFACKCNRTVPVRILYEAPERFGKSMPHAGLQWTIVAEGTFFEDRANIITRLDPTLSLEDVAGIILEKYNNFLCRFCGNPLVFNGKNGSGTPSLLCKHCNRKMSIWNTYELTLFKYKKILSAILTYIHSGSLQDSAYLYGIGKGLLNEVRWNLPIIKYTHNGDISRVEHDGLKYAVITIDMIYKGQKGLMLGVSGDYIIGVPGNENTGDGLPVFFSEIENKVDVDRYIFIMDMRRNVAKMILERWGERAIIVLQSHSVWGDVYVYFYRDGWYTLRLRTDMFSIVGKKRNEEFLLAPGEIELYEGLKGASIKSTLRNISTNTLIKHLQNLLDCIENTDWEAKGRIDLVMRPKIQKINSILQELKRRELIIIPYLTKLKTMINSLAAYYEHHLGHKIQQKIVNAWETLTVLESDVNQLSERLLMKPLKDKNQKTRVNKNQMQNDEKTKIKLHYRPRLIYKGKVDNNSLPEPARWILDLLKKVFDGKEITTNACEGRFGSFGLEIRRGRSIYLSRAATQVILRRGSLSNTLEYIITNYPISELGKRGIRGERKQLRVGRLYKITYATREGNKTDRTIEVINRIGKYIIAYCHLRNEIRTFKRSRIKSIIPIIT